MKIAFCLSGGPRFEYRGLFKLVDALKGYDQADFFIRTWKSEQYGQNTEEFVNYLKINSEGTLDKCNFPVVQVLHDDIRNAPPPKGPLNIADWAPNFLPMWWGIVQSYKLFVDHVAATGEQYDLVFRMRTDMVPRGEVDLREYVEKAKTKMINAKNFADNFLFGSPEMYQQFIGYWYYLDHLSRTGEFIHPEESLEKYFQLAEIDYECLPIIVEPQWNKGEYKGRWRMDHQ
jgi:hypothetical protein